MFDKTFNEMMKIDITPYIKKRDGNDYLPWAKCKMLLHQNGAEEVIFTPVTNANGSSLFMSEQVFTDSKGNTNRCYEVRVRVKIDNLKFESQYPVMNGSNPVKDNSMTQQRVNNALARAFVKGVAVHTGLGFSLWLDDDSDVPNLSENLEYHSLSKIKQRVEEQVTRLLQRGMSKEQIADRLGKSVEEFDMLFKYYGMLYRFETALNKL